MIVGCGRSGTTLVRAILDAHPSVAVPDETNILPRLVRDRRHYERMGYFATGLFLKGICGRHEFATWNLDPNDPRLWDAFGWRRVRTVVDAVRALYGFYAATRGKSRYGDKTPRYADHIPLLAETWPETKFIHVVRDGRDVALSFLESRFGATTVAQAATLWKRRVTTAHEAGQSLGPRRYLEVRYEHMVEDVEATAGSLCDFLNLEFSDKMGRYFETSGAIVAEHPDKYRNIDKPPRPTRNWRTEMSRDDLRVFHSIAGDALEFFGYESPAPSGSWLGAIRYATDPRTVKRRLRRERRFRLEPSQHRTGHRLTFPSRSLPTQKSSSGNEPAGDAGIDPSVQEYRSAFLPRGLIRVDEVHEWIMKQATDEGIRGRGPLIGYLAEGGQTLRHRTGEAPPLEQLFVVSRNLAARFRWDEPQAVTFVLTGILVEATPSPAAG